MSALDTLKAFGRAIPGRIWRNGDALSGGLAGAGVGALGSMGAEALGHRRGPDEEPKNYLGAAIRGGIVGGALGAGSGAALGAVRNVHLDTGLRGAGLAKEVAARGAQGVANFGKRQFHGLTGWKPEGGAGSMGLAGNEMAEQSVRRMETRAALGTGGHEAAQNLAKEVAGVRSSGHAAQEMYDRGLTSIPGAVQGLANDPKGSIKAMWGHLRGGGGKLPLIAAAAPAALAAPDILRGDESASGGRGMGEKLLHTAGGMGAGFLTGGIPIAPGILANEAIVRGAAAGGRAIDSSRAMLARVPPPPPQQQFPISQAYMG